MKKLLLTLFAAFFFLPLTFAQAADTSSSQIKKEDEIWRIRWFYTVPTGVPERPVKFVKLNDNGEYFVYFPGTRATMTLKRDQNKFTAEMKVGADVAILNGTINRGIVHGTWKAQSSHEGFLVGTIVNAK